jgi:hypothetical protein
MIWAVFTNIRKGLLKLNYQLENGIKDIVQLYKINHYLLSKLTAASSYSFFFLSPLSPLRVLLFSALVKILLSLSCISANLVASTFGLWITLTFLTLTFLTG